jgi:hypothetical protein
MKEGRVMSKSACSVRRSVTAQQAGIDPEDDTERTVSTVTRHGMKPQENPKEDLPYLEPSGAVCVQPQLSVAQHCQVNNTTLP